MKPYFKTCSFVLALGFACAFSSFAKQKSLHDQALEAMKTATAYMMDHVSYNGGFVWSYLPDFSRRWGEMEAKRTMIWTQAPGTPQVGHLMLDAYHATGDEYYYEQAKRVANALIWGQLECGGWNYIIDFAGEESLKDWYATVGQSGWRLEEFQHYYGNATFDDASTTQCAKFLLRMYLEKYDPVFRSPLDKTIDFILKSQYPVGGWPQRYPLMYDHPFQGMTDYTSFITLNDDVIPEATDFLLQCYQTLGIPGLKEPILRAMYLIILLQQGQPYAGWSDQYTVNDLKPAHARSYEPRAVNTGVTASMVRVLMKYYRLTGDTRFLAGIPAALDFIEAQRLPESEVQRWGRPSSDPDAFLVPRFIDPDDGKPLYVHRKGSNWFNGQYFIDQDITNTIGHYSSAGWMNTKRLREEYETLKKVPIAELTKDSPLVGKELVPLERFYTSARGSRAFSEQTVRDIIGSLDSEGRWLSPLTNTSNPYKAGASTVPSDARKYTSTNVGDEYDTSPYRNPNPVQGISTQDYINKMFTLILFVDEK
ncbi:MAG: pectate lyase [Candidatus Cryptobacteroides sp.]|jgi:PelA/Pel-15E family pectate lyase